MQLKENATGVASAQCRGKIGLLCLNSHAGSVRNGAEFMVNWLTCVHIIMTSGSSSPARGKSADNAFIETFNG